LASTEAVKALLVTASVCVTEISFKRQRHIRVVCNRVLNEI
jgi:hypothetical protein